MRITADHVKELANLHGDNVLVPQGEEGTPWVISTQNQHYRGAHTVIATSEQVTDLALDADFDEDGDLTDEAAERIARKLSETPREEARGYARGMAQHDDGTRRMAEGTARSILGKVTAARDELKAWEGEHRNVADWRVNDALEGLSKARRALDYLLADTDPEGDAARASMRAAFGE
ncbi:hypothetical protein QFZ75_008009 [Streptomyces sp. V3I8]|uniref:hypothetical protein n=1 Tax=Streptomyces sp. V3I8 TaxID=3042279 RepID=UPI002780A356|nr:hypothetical protein [Streptomyces sp. V3I8]MDQ1041507.1 hypothetical protein [Streptomyces sp. V3I8]